LLNEQETSNLRFFPPSSLFLLQAFAPRVFSSPDAQRFLTSLFSFFFSGSHTPLSFVGHLVAPIGTFQADRLDGKTMTSLQMELAAVRR